MLSCILEHSVYLGQSLYSDGCGKCGLSYKVIGMNKVQIQIAAMNENDAGKVEHDHVHGHYHSPEEKKKQLNRLAKASGHLTHVKMMIENDEDCSEVLMQLAAVESALHSLGKEIINEHLTHCITHAIEDGDTEAIEEFKKAISKYM